MSAAVSPTRARRHLITLPNGMASPGHRLAAASFVHPAILRFPEFSPAETTSTSLVHSPMRVANLRQILADGTRRSPLVRRLRFDSLTPVCYPLINSAST